MLQFCPLTAKIAPLLNRFFEKSVHFKNNLCFLFFNDVGRLPIVASFLPFDGEFLNFRRIFANGGIFRDVTGIFQIGGGVANK